MLCAATLVFLLPAGLAFSAGGYFAVGRSIGLIVAFSAFALCALFAPSVFPKTLEGRLTLGGLIALCATTAALVAGAPAAGPAFADFQRLLLYVVFLAAAMAVVASPRLRALCLPTLLGGITVVCAYAILGRCLPSAFEQTNSIAAQGRLEQPISYWNALGIYAGLGLVIASGIIADGDARPATRAMAVATIPTVAATLALTLSRGAIAATVIGLLLLPAISRTRLALSATTGAGLLALISGLTALGFPSLRASVRDPSEIQAAGITLLVVLVGLSAVAAVAAYALRPPNGRLNPITSWALTALLVATLVGVPVLVATGQNDSGAPPGGRSGAVANRLVSAKGSRLSYWKVAADGFRESPLIGEGPSSFRIRWLRERPFPEAANDAHSLYVETAAELGIVGMIALATFLAGVLVGAIRATRASASQAAPAIAVLGAFLLHAGLDWDWEVPTVALVGLGAASLVVTASRATAGDAYAPRRRISLKRSTGRSIA